MAGKGFGQPGLTRKPCPGNLPQTAQPQLPANRCGHFLFAGFAIVPVMDKHLQTFDAVHAELPAFEGAAVPEWVHLLPTSSGAVQTLDKRGPYHVNDAELIIKNSFAEADKLPIDQDHAMDLAAKEGRPAPARGWIVEMQSRQDGIWGHVEWTKSGRELLEDRAYSGISPVIRYLATPGKDIVAIRRASLVNGPNLRGLHSLNQETDTMFQETIAKALGLPADASEGDISKALAALKSKGTGKEDNALQSQLGEIGTALGCETGATAQDILTAAQSVGSSESETVTALQATVTELSATVTGLQEGTKKSKAESFVDGAIQEKRVGVSAQRDRFIALHQRDPEGTETLIAGLPTLGATHTDIVPPKAEGEATSLNAAEDMVATQLGISAEDFAKAGEESQ